MHYCRCVCCSQEGASGLSQAGVVQDVEKTRKQESGCTWVQPNNSVEERLVNQSPVGRRYTCSSGSSAFNSVDK